VAIEAEFHEKIILLKAFVAFMGGYVDNCSYGLFFKSQANSTPE
jgi:hypothetical protein